MKIETYEIEEVKGSEASTLAADGEALILIEKLGLKGQQQLLSSDGTGTRFCYPIMTKLEALVYGTCFPMKTELTAFAVEIIPIRVLQVAAFCKDFPQTAWLEVWHPATSKVDPVLVGRRSHYSGDNYLLARWGNALDSFEVLTERARKIYAENAKLKVMKLQSELEVMAKNMEYSIAKAFVDGDEPSFYLNA